MMDLSVPAPNDGERLDRFLAAAQADLSRNRLQSLIRDGRVLVNGKPCRASHRLHEGDRVRVDVPPPEPSAIVAEDLPLDVVYEDDAVIIVNKPAGIVVHPGAGVKTGTLVHALLHHDPAIATVGGEGRPGIVHRLDRETSGLMVVARSAQAYRALIELMRTREIRRTYLALVWGDPREDEGVLESSIGRDPRDRKRMTVVKRGGRPARTLWRVLERFGLATLLEIRLDTGRTHQIRVHMASRRLPVVGDPVYGGRGKKQLSLDAVERSLANALLACIRRQALHASELELPHPVHGRTLRFTSHVPSDFDHALERLRASRSDRRG